MFERNVRFSNSKDPFPPLSLLAHWLPLDPHEESVVDPGILPDSGRQKENGDYFNVSYYFDFFYFFHQSLLLHSSFLLLSTSGPNSNPFHKK